MSDDILKIKKIEIKNFRGIKELSIDNLKNINYIFGMNGSNKSTLILALRLMLDKGFKNKYDFTDEDFNVELDDDVLSIIIHLNYTSTTNNSSPHIDFINDMWFKMEVERIGDDKFVPKIFESIDDGENWNETYGRDWAFTNGISLTYINPNYNLDDSKNEFIRDYKSMNRTELNDDLTNLQNSTREKITEVIDENSLSKLEEVDSLLSNDNNKVIKVSNDAKSILSYFDLKLNLSRQTSITHFINDKQIKSRGDGIERVESINIDLAKGNLKGDEKIRLILIEEIENNLHISLQQNIMKSISKVYGDKLIMFVTTHSPNVIHYGRGYNFIRFGKQDKVFSNELTLNDDGKILSKNFSPFFQKGIAEALFYENVYIVEGDTEILFYDLFYKYNENFKKIIDDNNIFIHSVGGAYGYLFRNFFNGLGIKAKVKIDNDLNSELDYHRVKKAYKASRACSGDPMYTGEFKSPENDNEVKEIILELKSKCNIYFSTITESFEGEVSKLEDVSNVIDGDKLKSKKAKYLYELISDDKLIGWISEFDIHNYHDNDEVSIFDFIKEYQ